MVSNGRPSVTARLCSQAAVVDLGSPSDESYAWARCLASAPPTGSHSVPVTARWQLRAPDFRGSENMFADLQLCRVLCARHAASLEPPSTMTRPDYQINLAMALWRLLYRDDEFRSGVKFRRILVPKSSSLPGLLFPHKLTFRPATWRCRRQHQQISARARPRPRAAPDYQAGPHATSTSFLMLLNNSHLQTIGISPRTTQSVVPTSANVWAATRCNFSAQSTTANHPTAALSTSSTSAITNSGAGCFSFEALPSCFSAIVKREIEPLRSPISGGVCPEGVVASTA